MLNHDPKKRPTAKRARLTYKKSLEIEPKVINRVFIAWDECEGLGDSDEESILSNSDCNEDSDENMEIKN